MATNATKDEIIQGLRGAGKELSTLTSHCGQTVVLLPYGGRILGLFFAESPSNVLWTHPALAAAETARELYESSRWHNSGGDRTWLAPERDYFYPDFPDTSRYVQPKQFDAGNFEIAAQDAQRIELRTEFTLRSYRTAANLRLELTKAVSFTSDPLATKSSPLAADELEFAGYRLETSLVAAEPLAEDACVGIWNLLQMPGGGAMFAPTYFRTEPTVFFGDIPAGHVRVENRFVRYQMEAQAEQKICISALASTGRLGYLRQEGDAWVLVVRDFRIDPTGAYRDVWPSRPEDDGYAVQICNINADYLGYFAELEYHAPAICAGAERQSSCDVSDVWAYRGERDAITAAAKYLLGVDVCD